MVHEDLHRILQSHVPLKLVSSKTLWKRSALRFLDAFL